MPNNKRGVTAEATPPGLTMSGGALDQATPTNNHAYPRSTRNRDNEHVGEVHEDVVYFPGMKGDKEGPGDERAAGVIYGEDPYRELELYLEKVQDEIGEVFNSWNAPNNFIISLPANDSKKQNLKVTESAKKKAVKYNINTIDGRVGRGAEDAWTDGLLSEFNTIIKQELDALSFRQDSNHSLNDVDLKISFPRIHAESTVNSSRYINDPKLDSYLSNCECVITDAIDKNSQKAILGEEEISNNESDAILWIGCIENEELQNGHNIDYSIPQDINKYVASPTTKQSPNSNLLSPETVLTKDAVTQTSPGSLSPSSSLTWVSYSSLCDREDTVDDDNKSTSSNDDSLQDNSKDELSCDCLSSDSLPGTPNHEEAESGIGTASPPRDKDSWKRLRRRSCSAPHSLSLISEPLIWIRREDAMTQTNDEGSSENFLDSSNYSSPDELQIVVVSKSKKAHRPCCLPLGSSEDTYFGCDFDQPSPSTTSLRLVATPLAADLGNKSSSAPILLKKCVTNAQDGLEDDIKSTMRTLSHSDRQLTEIEAAEACKWLRAAGFPQYAQMYEDLQFPIDLSGVQKDHPFLEADPLKSLYRRLGALNRCATMRLDIGTKHNTHQEDSDDDTQCALSENWTYLKHNRRWSRVDDIVAQHSERLQQLHHAAQHASGTKHNKSQQHLVRENTPDRLQPPGQETEEAMLESLRYGSLPPGALLQADSDLLQVRFRRTGSERLRDGAKALLRRVESLKTRRRKRQNRDGVVISGPQVLDVMTMQQKMKDMNCVDVSPTNNLSFELPTKQPPSPLATPPLNAKLSPLPYGDDSSSYCSDGSQGSGSHHKVAKSKPSRARRFLQRGGVRQEESGALSDSECQPSSWKQRYFKDANSNNTKLVEYLDVCDAREQHSSVAASSASPGGTKLPRGGSLNLGKDSQRYRDRLRHSIRREHSAGSRDSRSSELSASHDSGSTIASHDSGDEDVTQRNKCSVVRWHSFQRTSRPDSTVLRTSDRKVSTEEDPETASRPVGGMSCGQLQVLRKMALLTLTGFMERYCPTHRTGWNWELPKFIRKIKTPDYKDKTVFGVPLSLSMQRTGQALPKCIQIALRWLRLNAMEQVGLFRKSGVRSRILLLKTMTESQGDAINYDGQQAYDVADMVKQYFRELPEALLTNKLSETFIAIFQHVPEHHRHDAAQCALLLLPDEHREALQTLLDFLHHVTDHVEHNQMTVKNLAVCLAPSLFHSAHGHGANTTPSKKGSGIPDQRELQETRATHECLQFLIKESRSLCVIGKERLQQCHFSYMDESVPVALAELGAELQQTWSGYQYACTTALLKEAREKSRGWVSVTSVDPSIEMAYKKVGDGHPLRLWRVSTEAEAPPQEVLHRILRERHIWDTTLLKYRVVEKLENQSEIFQYVSGNMPPLGARDFCVLRSWRSDLSKGACVLVETSVEHPLGPLTPGAVRGVVLASRYLIEPCGSGRSRVMHMSRVDTKGRTPEFYTKTFGHMCGSLLTKLRLSFTIKSEGPESKV